MKVMSFIRLHVIPTLSFGVFLSIEGVIIYGLVRAVMPK
jgi:hypothetical protein